MEQNREQPRPQQVPGDRHEPLIYLNHGVESLVAQDNPDDSQLGAEKAPKRGSRR